MILCLGLPNSGKTVLLRRLMSYPQAFEKFETVGTVGTNIVHLNCSSNPKETITLQEIGGEMKPIWPQYFNQCQAIIYTLDTFNPVDISCNCIALLDILGHNLIADGSKSLLILLTKSDITANSNNTSRGQVTSALLMDDIISSFPNNDIKVKPCSSVTGQGIASILSWIEEKSRSPSS